ILLVDDEEALVAGLRYSLTREGFEVEVAGDGAEALLQAERIRPDLVLLDVMMPRIDGLEVCRELRARGFEAPILLLTCRGEETDKVIGLEVGADDYVTKPFATRELIARVRAHLRRWQKTRPAIGRNLRAEGLMLDLERHEAQTAQGPVSLSAREFDLLHLLMENWPRVLTREQLMDRIWGYDFEGEANVLQVAVGRLRDKIEREPSLPRFVLTVRGVGYRFDVPVSSC
ncbi:unnamed protein product, partial [Phaeothamnion confervicola]